MKKAACVLSLLLTLPSVAAQAGTQASGPEFHAGSCTDCEKRFPAVAGTKTGEFVVVWQGASRTDPQAILARFFAKTGAPRGVQVQVNKQLPPDQYDAAVAVDPSGNYIVVWSEVINDNSEIFVQRFNSKAKAVGTAVKVNVDDPAAPATPLDVYPVVAATPDGGFVVAWIGAVPPSDTDRIPPVVQFRRFNKNGAPLGPQIRLNTGLVRGIRPDVCVSNAGQAVVVWTSVDGFRPFQNNKKGISMRRVAKTGAPAGPEVVVAQPKAYDSDGAVSCAPNGTFVVVWHTDETPAVDRMDVLGQRYTPLGRKSGAIFRVNSQAPNDQRDPAISHDASGNFVVVWESREPEVTRIIGRRFKANGTADGADFVIDTQAEGEPMPDEAEVAHIGSAGEFVVVWQAGQEDVVGRRYKITASRR
jgi:hypothetical protein